MSLSFEVAAPKILKIEAGYSNNPSDSGGETNWGITVAVARAYGYTGAMIDMRRETALLIYRERFWDSMLLDDVGVISAPVAWKLFDIGVNMGVDRAGHYLQRALNLFNAQGVLYRDIKQDGRIGRMTIAALREFLGFRKQLGERVLVEALRCQQGDKYLDLAETRSKDETFVFGWFANRILEHHQ